MPPPSPPPTVDDAEVAAIAARVHAAARSRAAAVLKGPVGRARLETALAAARAKLEGEIEAQLTAEKEAALAAARAGQGVVGARVRAADGVRVVDDDM